MTCIVGLKHKGGIYIGGDSACAENSFLYARKDTKVFKVGEFIYGYTSSFRMGQLLRYKFKPPQRELAQDVFEYMTTDFIDALRECFNKAGYAEVKNGMESGGDFLVGYQNRLFEIRSDYQAGESILDYHSCGCGREVALGAMYASEGLNPEARIQKALEAAERFNPYVRSPFVIESLAVEEEKS